MGELAGACRQWTPRDFRVQPEAALIGVYLSPCQDASEAPMGVA
jgi:hypothetical protein